MPGQGLMVTTDQSLPKPTRPPSLQRKLDAWLAITFVSNIEELQLRAEKLNDPGAELEDACEYVVELALTMLQPGAAESPARIALKTCCMARMAEWFGSGDRLLSILESQEAKS
jgi:hypothetical protein